MRQHDSQQRKDGTKKRRNLTALDNYDRHKRSKPTSYQYPSAITHDLSQSNNQSSSSRSNASPNASESATDTVRVLPTSILLNSSERNTRSPIDNTNMQVSSSQDPNSICHTPSLSNCRTAITSQPSPLLHLENKPVPVPTSETRVSITNPLRTFSGKSKSGQKKNWNCVSTFKSPLAPNSQHSGQGKRSIYRFPEDMTHLLFITSRLVERYMWNKKPFINAIDLEMVIEKCWKMAMKSENIWSIAFEARTKEILKEVRIQMDKVKSHFIQSARDHIADLYGLYLFKSDDERLEHIKSLLLNNYYLFPTAERFENGRPLFFLAESISTFIYIKFFHRSVSRGKYADGFYNVWIQNETGQIPTPVIMFSCTALRHALFEWQKCNGSPPKLGKSKINMEKVDRSNYFNYRNDGDTYKFLMNTWNELPDNYKQRVHTNILATVKTQIQKAKFPEPLEIINTSAATVDPSILQQFLDSEPEITQPNIGNTDGAVPMENVQSDDDFFFDMGQDSEDSNDSDEGAPSLRKRRLVGSMPRDEEFDLDISE